MGVCFFLSPIFDKMLDVSNLLCVFMLDLTYFCVSVSLVNVYNSPSTTFFRWREYVTGLIWILTRTNISVLF